MDTKVPTQKDWQGYEDDLDSKDAYETFFGKTNKEIQKEFKEREYMLAEPLLFMPLRPFRYYVMGFRDAVLDADFGSFAASDIASSFLRLIEAKLDSQPNHILPVMDDLLQAIDFVGKHQTDFDAPEHIYGNFQEIGERIRKRYYDLTGTAAVSHANSRSADMDLNIQERIDSSFPRIELELQKTQNGQVIEQSVLLRRNLARKSPDSSCSNICEYVTECDFEVMDTLYKLRAVYEANSHGVMIRIMREGDLFYKSASNCYPCLEVYLALRSDLLLKIIMSVPYP